jgi:hypothetical protein
MKAAAGPIDAAVLEDGRRIAVLTEDEFFRTQTPRYYKLLAKLSRAGALSSAFLAVPCEGEVDPSTGSEAGKRTEEAGRRTEEAGRRTEEAGSGTRVVVKVAPAPALSAQAVRLRLSPEPWTQVRLHLSPEPWTQVRLRLSPEPWTQVRLRLSPEPWTQVRGMPAKLLGRLSLPAARFGFLEGSLCQQPGSGLMCA